MRYLAALFVAALFVVAVYAQDKSSTPGLAQAFQLGYAVGCGADWGLSYIATNYLGYTELNPPGKIGLHSPGFGFALQVAQGIAFAGISDLLFKADKTVGWVFTIAGFAVKAYVVYRNVITLSRGASK